MHGLVYQPWCYISTKHGYFNSEKPSSPSLFIIEFFFIIGFCSLCTHLDYQVVTTGQLCHRSTVTHTTEVENKRKEEEACCLNIRTENDFPEAMKNHPTCWLCEPSTPVLTLIQNWRLGGHLRLVLCPRCNICDWSSAPGAIHPIAARRASHSFRHLPRTHDLHSRCHANNSLHLLCFSFLTSYLPRVHPTPCWASQVIRKSKWKLQSETRHRNPTPVCGEIQQQACKLDTVICEIDLAASNKTKASGVPWATGNFPYRLSSGRFGPFSWWTARITFILPHYHLYSSLVSAFLINTMTQSSLGRKGLISVCSLQSVLEGSWGTMMCALEAATTEETLFTGLFPLPCFLNNKGLPD